MTKILWLIVETEKSFKNVSLLFVQRLTQDLFHSYVIKYINSDWCPQLAILHDEDGKKTYSDASRFTWLVAKQ